MRSAPLPNTSTWIFLNVELFVVTLKTQQIRFLKYFRAEKFEISLMRLTCLHETIFVRLPQRGHNYVTERRNTYLSKHRSTLSLMSRSMQSCSSAISCMSRSSPWPIESHSSSVSGSTSPIWGEASKREAENHRLIR